MIHALLVRLMNLPKWEILKQMRVIAKSSLKKF
jgi:hypothetical protein